MDHSLLDQLADVARLPVAASTVRAIVALCGEEGFSEIELCAAMERDPGMSLWMLRQANSGLFSTCGAVGGVGEAVACMGARASKIVSLSMVPASGGFVAGGIRGTVAEVWARARMRDRVVEKLGGLMDEGGAVALARTAAHGLECAWFTLAIADPERGAEMMRMEQEGGSGSDIEALSAGVMDRWGVDEVVCDAVRGCSDLGACGVEMGAEQRLVCAAEMVVRHAMGRGEWRDRVYAGERFAAVTGLGPGTMGELARDVGSKYERDLREWLGSDEDVVRSSAVEALARLSLAIHAEHHRVVHQRDELLHRVTLDRLTGVFNRGAFDDRLAEEMERARRGNEPLALLMCDLDEFKTTNDLHGHQAGDHILKRVAEEMVEAARRIDVVARYGGEEFVVIAPRCDYPGAAFLAERLRAAVAGLRLEWGGASLSVTMSIGGAVCTWPGAMLMPEHLIAAADRRLYDAKRSGRNCVRIDGPDRLRAWAG